jgi:hypothetical protein
MTVKAQRYARKPFYVDAVQVTAENIEDVAKWCQGDVRLGRKPESNKDENYISVRVHMPLKDRQTMAFVGDWVLYAGQGFKVYTPNAFDNSFDLAEETGTDAPTQADTVLTN